MGCKERTLDYTVYVGWGVFWTEKVVCVFVFKLLVVRIRRALYGFRYQYCRNVELGKIAFLRNLN